MGMQISFFRLAKVVFSCMMPVNVSTGKQFLFGTFVLWELGYLHSKC